MQAFLAMCERIHSSMNGLPFNRSGFNNMELLAQHSNMKKWPIDKVVDSFLYNFAMLSGCSIYKGVKTCWKPESGKVLTAQIFA